MKLKFNEGQRKTCLLAVRHLNAAIVVLLNKDERGKVLIDKGSALLQRIGHNGENLAEAELTSVEVDTLVRALNATHFIYVLSKKLPVPNDERQQTLRYIRQCMSALK